MKRYQGIVEVTSITRYRCQVVAENETDARRKLESGMDGLENTYPCECGCNATEGIRKVHSIKQVSVKH